MVDPPPMRRQKSLVAETPGAISKTSTPADCLGWVNMYGDNVFNGPNIDRPMISRTFRVLPGVGPATEGKILSCGVLDWYGFLDRDAIPVMSPRRKSDCDRLLESAISHLEAGETRPLAAMLPRNEEWRLFGRFGRDAAFLDIETDGLHAGARVTMVSVHRGGYTTTLTLGRDLNASRLSDALDDAPLLVTFNGKCFDVPMLRNAFPGLDLGMPNMDLRYAGRKANLTGGLCRVEEALGVRRDGDLASVDGAEAVRLWTRWERRNDIDALELLTEYNRADTENLAIVADRIYGRLSRV